MVANPYISHAYDRLGKIFKIRLFSSASSEWELNFKHWYSSFINKLILLINKLISFLLNTLILVLNDLHHQCRNLLQIQIETLPPNHLNCQSRLHFSSCAKIKSTHRKLNRGHYCKFQQQYHAQRLITILQETIDKT